jgi:hypothetical protein
VLALLALGGSMIAAALGPAADRTPSVSGLLLSLLLGG